MPQNTKMLIGAIVAAALAIAVYYGLISPQTANTIQTQTNQTLQTGPAGQQPAPAPQSPASQVPPPPQAPTSQTPAPTGPAPQNPPSAPR